MNLDDAQRKKVAEWVAQGLKLSEIQTRLAGELGLRLTYMDVRLLVDDLKLVPKDAERARSMDSPLAKTAASPPGAPAAAGQGRQAAAAEPEPVPPAGGGVTVTVDQLARAGAMVSGKVTFSDGQRAEWYFDHTGRLGLAPQRPGYRPPAADLQQFQAALDAELSKMGF